MKDNEWLKWFLRYARHRPGCRWQAVTREDRRCTCGFALVKERAEAFASPDLKRFARYGR